MQISLRFPFSYNLYEVKMSISVSMSIYYLYLYLIVDKGVIHKVVTDRFFTTV